MPITVRHEIAAVDVRQGDRLSSEVDPDMVVTKVERKVAWTTIHLADHARPMRMRNEDKVVVLRQQPTDEEKAARLRELYVDSLRKDLRNLLRRNPLHELEAIVEKARQYEGNGAIVTYSNLGDVLEAQALYKQGVAIRAAIHHRSDVDINTPDDVLTLDEDVLLDAWAVWYYENVMRNNHFSSPRNPLSRSTSPLSNIFDDLDVWAVQKVQMNVLWSQGVDELKARVARMLAEAEAKKQAGNN